MSFKIILIIKMEKFSKYKCSICQDILTNPVTLIKCFHEFCHKCIQSYIKSTLKNFLQLTCPLCRKEFKQSDYVMATDLQKEIENYKIHCKCGELISIQKFEEHKEKCICNFKKGDGTIKGNYNCTLCDKKGMNREEYVFHIREFHNDSYGVCAICSVQPWGDKNYKTFLLGHVDLRHQKEITKNAHNSKELEILKKVIDRSKYEK